ncbi:hypothetical protein AB0A91_11050 [Streptomyces sp. NPDC042207]|uniref:hypothetical protein n=1 Tax=Streptomyces sp. NPDC042207 TaxID=3154331 RepID=UPI0033E92FAD
MTAAAAALVTACSGGAVPADRSSTAGGPQASPARLGYDLPDDPATMLFPATGAETRWTQGLEVFTQQVARVTAASCARDTGTGFFGQPPLAFIRFSDVPDLDFVARHGFGQSAEVPEPTAPAPSAGAPATGRSADHATARDCRGRAQAAAETLRGPYAGLQAQWLRGLSSLHSDPAVARALRSLPACFSAHGVKARDEDGFFARADAALNTAAPTELPCLDREFGSVYATCMRPVEAVREPARVRARRSFLTENATEVRDLRRDLVPSLRRAERRYGVRLAFPAP